MAQAQDIGTLDATPAVAGAPDKGAVMRCRICQSTAIVPLGLVEFYSGYRCQIWDCRDCGSRFTGEQGPIHDVLHGEASSSYALYRDLAETSKRHFDRGDLQKLRQSLAIHGKYRFVIDAVEKGAKQSSILEVGCSRGHLTAYFILAGYNILGTDISPHAAKAAEQHFGKYFALAGSPIATQRAPYDVVFHVGTIGCVPDPLGFTQSLLALLRPGGRLIFNAPNVDGCYLDGQLWVDGAFPPDLLTLFKKGFWSKHFSDKADVVETVQSCSPEQNAMLSLKQVFGRTWTPPAPVPLDAGINDLREGRKPQADHLWHNIARIIHRTPAAILRLVPAKPDPFGLFVTMTKK